MQPHLYTRRVNYYETDRMGIAHHTNYLRYFEEARLDLMRTLGCSALDLERQGIIIPNVDAYAKYLQILRFEDEFTVAVTPAEFTGVRMRFEYEIRRGDTLCCTGHTTHCFVGADMRPLLLRRAHPDVHARLEEIFSKAK